MADKAFTWVAVDKVNVLHCSVAISIASMVDPKPKYVEYVAIWDTGATSSVITKKIADDLGLQPIGMTQVSTAGGLHDCNIYIVNIVLPNSITISNVRVTEAPLNGFDVLIGMDIISIGDFAVSSTKQGNTVVSFRIPHDDEPVDFVKIAQDEANKKRRKKVSSVGHKKLQDKRKKERQSKKKSRK